MAEQVNGTVVESDAENIRSTLGAAFDAVEKASAPEAAKPEPKADAKAEPELPLSEGQEQPRGKDGKFAPKDGSAEPAAAAAEPAEGAAQEEKPEGEAEPEAAKEQPDAELQKATQGWKADDREMLKKLSPEAQGFIVRRHKEMNADYTKKLQGISRLKNEYEPVDKIFEPHREIMRQKGFTPASLVQLWANVEQRLAASPEEAAKVVVGLVNGYGIDRSALMTMLGVQATPQPRTENPAMPANPEAPAAQRIELPPELKREIEGLKQTVNGLTSAQQRAVEQARADAAQRAETEAEKFRSATDASGNLLHPYVDEVEGDILALAQAHVAAKQTIPPIAELYERAVWANPSTREKIRTAEAQAAEKKRVDQEKAKAAAARKAAVSVTGAPGNGQASQVRSAPERSLRDELEANMAETAA